MNRVQTTAFRLLAAFVVSWSCFASRTQAQTSSPSPAPTPAQPSAHHRFFDAENDWLFAGVAASRALDYTSTRSFRSRGFHEGLLTDRIVDNKPLFISIEAAGTAASIGLSYVFHRTDHHKLERWVSILHIGVSTVGTVRNYQIGR
ncbi:MAG: hypothetical protein M3268_04685 [Acidobacteriota bacterium]|nr:hypothetical protein [Acidobacteriota bacterium]MDQ3907623.1 hypothetical protein [Acidobacteriota bacterium]